QRRHVEVGVELGEMDAKAEGFHFDHLEVVYGSVLQALDITRREAEFDTRRQPDDDAIAASVVMRALGTWPTHPQLSTSLGRLKFLLGQLNHGIASMRPSTRPDGPRSVAGPCVLLARCSWSPPGLLARSD